MPVWWSRNRQRVFQFAGTVLAVILIIVLLKDGGWNDIVDAFKKIKTADLLWVALLFGLINGFIGSLVKLLTLPAILLSLGLFAFVINAAMLTLVDRWSDVLTIDKFTSALIGALIISLISGFTNKLINKA